MPRKETPQGAISAQQQQDIVSEGMENFELPKSLVTRIARSALPENVKLQKETVLSLIKGSTVFINYLGATAHDVALSKQHKSISASDVLKALEMIEFGDLVDKLQAELLVYREQAKTDKSKKGSSNVNGNVPKGKTTTPVASTTKSVKGKEKATIVLPPLASNSTPVDADPSESISSGPGMAMDVDEDIDVDADPSVQVDTDGEGEGVRLEEEEEAEDAEDIEEEPEELVDTVALDVQDLKRDSRGPDEVSWCFFV
ncbi:histone-fold-containing protein [Mycena alexandri]|uniref:DNA polymerase epsilon subunit D n=1 Tax=Mycena alexandri TaxID=1745969 RepID=A0AAD6TJL7_9AGAR|nr:histone-fold-containing protein [Mycena alexandri]